MFTFLEEIEAPGKDLKNYVVTIYASLDYKPSGFDIQIIDMCIAVKGEVAPWILRNDNFEEGNPV